jgi:hypothetical protein
MAAVRKRVLKLILYRIAARQSAGDCLQRISIVTPSAGRKRCGLLWAG